MAQPITILHIEDTLDNRILVRRLLQSEGYNVIEASNAFEALDLLETHQPDLVLMDINMPEMDGYTLTAKIKALPKMVHVPIIAITANVMKGDREKSLSAGCNGYIEKPIDIDRFLDQIALFLKSARRFA